MNQLLHENLENAARKHADHEAFRCTGKSITYEELNTRAGQLATLLRESGVKVNDSVAIRMMPSIESAIAVYGILKAGCAFVPIDPTAPEKRVCELIEVGQIRSLITDSLNERTLSALEKTSALKSIVGPRLDSNITSIEWGQLYDFEVSAPASVSQDAPAYVIFTSGSTGTPKGIMHTHASGNSYARLSVKTYGVGPGDRIANLSPLHFDMSTFGYLSSVRAAATTVLIPPSYAMLPASLAKLIADESISIWYSVPFALIQLLDRGVLEQHEFSNLRWVMFGGEPFSPEVINELRQHWPIAKFSNVYGPAEVNQCTYFHIPSHKESPEKIASDQSVPIGSVWPETEIRIVDENDTPVEVGADGELLVNSTTMMARYWNGTSEDSHTFHFESGKRFYRTGDMVRERADGELMFLGRADRQVKIRGYRIELDEVEHALKQHPSVQEAAVVCSETDLLSAAIIDLESDVEPSEIRHFLASKLPSYAIPKRVELRKTLPRTTSGKIDRGALKTELTSRFMQTQPR